MRILQGVWECVLTSQRETDAQFVKLTEACQHHSEVRRIFWQSQLWYFDLQLQGDVKYNKDAVCAV